MTAVRKGRPATARLGKEGKTPAEEVTQAQQRWRLTMRSAKRLSSAPVQSFLSAVGHADEVTLAPSRHDGCGGLESARTTVLTRVLSLLGSVLVTSSRLGPLRQPLVRAPVVTL